MTRVLLGDLPFHAACATSPGLDWTLRDKGAILQPRPAFQAVQTPGTTRPGSCLSATEPGGLLTSEQRAAGQNRWPWAAVPTVPVSALPDQDPTLEPCWGLCRGSQSLVPGSADTWLSGPKPPDLGPIAPRANLIIYGEQIGSRLAAAHCREDGQWLLSP